MRESEGLVIERWSVAAVLTPTHRRPKGCGRGISRQAASQIPLQAQPLLLRRRRLSHPLGRLGVGGGPQVLLERAEKPLATLTGGGERAAQSGAGAVELGGGLVDARTDLYAVGSMFFELLTGEPYLAADSEGSLLRIAETPTFRKPSSIEGVDARFDRIVERLLARFPEARPRNAQAVKKELAAIAASMDRIEEQLAGQGRLLVRYSGTEPLLRVMIEGRDQQEIQGWAHEIADSVKRHLG